MRNFWFVLAGIGLIGLGVWQYFDLTAFEQSEGSRRLHWLLAWLYDDMGGKWPTVIFLSGIGAMISLTGLATSHRLQRPEA